jgi:hypothetical protein
MYMQAAVAACQLAVAGQEQYRLWQCVFAESINHVLEADNLSVSKVNFGTMSRKRAETTTCQAH